MLTYQNQMVHTSVRRLVEFLLREGNISTGTGLIQDVEAMQAGSRLHRKIQRAQKATYQSEVSLKMTWPQEDYQLILEGRADGIDRILFDDILNEPDKDVVYQGNFDIICRCETENGNTKDEKINNKKINDENISDVNIDGENISDKKTTIVLIDEIKCVYKDVKNIEEAEKLHLAQAKCYAYMYGFDKDLSEVVVQITYCNIETEEKKYIRSYFKMEELEEWFHSLIDEYKIWADYFVEARKQRNQSIDGLEFPFTFRPGQKTMTAMVYRAVEEKRHIFLQAPTGIGKTISTIYPVLKALSAGKAEKMFYLTAKTITRTVAESTLNLLKKQKLKLKAVTITAKEKICVNEVMECNPISCTRAKGHFDRINQALYHMLTEKESMTREDILEYSEKYQVCPYELSFEAAQWADCMICDYNYIFDPHVNRKSMFGDKNGRQNILLVDEAHNLLDRAREMYSADISREDFVKMRKIFRTKSKYVTKKLQNCILELSKFNRDAASTECYQNVDDLYYPLFRLLGPLEDYLTDHPELEEQEEVVQFYFNIRHFFMTMDMMEEGYQVYGEMRGKDCIIHLFCVDPSARLEEYLEKSRVSIFFSATMLPIQYYKQLLGGHYSVDAFCIPSPFPKEKRLLAIASDVTSRYSRRGEEQYRRIVRYMEETIEEKPGKYMIFFPSYEMLSNVCHIAENSTLSMAAELLIQEPSMKEREREAFLEEFEKEKNRSLIGFCVLGSIFSEGIDLAGKRLIGVMIVGTGLPQICKEREMIRTYFDTHQKKGYDYAYRYPGMNKVLQAAGRVIRTAEDVGTILLLDDRFLLEENQVLLPEEWDSFYEVNLSNYRNVLRKFWKGQMESKKTG